MGRFIKVSDNILDLVGNTPLVPLRRLNTNPNVRVLAKLEMFNPGGSVKARPALKMIRAAEETGELTSDKVILEATSGNTGIGLAMVAAVKGYRIKLAMSESVSEERRSILAGLGAQFLLTDPALGTDGAIDLVYRLIRRQPEKYFVPDQYNNPNNPLSHIETTAPEIWEQTGGRITHFVAAMGTTGTVVGTSRGLKAFNPNIRVVAVEPYLNHRIQGLKNLKEAYKPGIWDKTAIDRKVNIRDEDAFEMTRALAREEGLFVGMSSGAAAFIALQMAREMKEGVIVVLLPDGGERYLSTSLFAAAKPVKPSLTLKLYNAVTRSVEPFKPLNDSVGIYACGPTAYVPMHIGLARRVVLSDLLRRYIEFSGIGTKLVMNITDMDDRTIAAARKQGVPHAQLTQQYTEMFMEDLKFLSVRPAHKYPRASQCVEDMFAMTKKLVDKGFAYEKLRSVYFDISKQSDYGSFSGLDLTKIQTGKTVDLDDYEKADPKDFTLLKRATLADLKMDAFYETDWGNIRPSWHIQCIAISTRYLGEQFDIHVSGKDLIFPHHENTIAIGKAVYGKSPARFFVLSDLVYTDGKKMSRSAGSQVTLRDLEKQGYTGRELRYMLLKTHYRKPMLFSLDLLKKIRTDLRDWDCFINRITRGCTRNNDAPGKDKQVAADMIAGFKAGMDMDLNVSLAMAALHKFRKTVNTMFFTSGLSDTQCREFLHAISYVNEVLGIFDVPSAPKPVPDDVKDMADKRMSAKAKKDFKTADKLRDRIMKAGFRVMDVPDGFVLDPICEINGKEVAKTP